MAENESIYKIIARTQDGKDEEEIKKRNKKAMKIDFSIFSNHSAGEAAPESPGIIKTQLLRTDEEKIRREKENKRTQEEDRNVALRTDPNGDTVTRRGNIINDRTSQPIEKWKQDIEERKKLKKAKLNESKQTKEERVKK